MNIYFLKCLHWNNLRVQMEHDSKTEKYPAFIERRLSQTNSWIRAFRYKAGLWCTDEWWNEVEIFCQVVKKSCT